MNRSFQLSLIVHGAMLALWMFVLGQRASYFDPDSTHQAEVIPLELTFSKDREDPSRNRIVQTTLSEPEKVRPKDGYLGAQNQQVDRETVSKAQQVRQGLRAATRSLPKSSANPRAGSARNSMAHLGVPVLPSQRDAASKTGVSPDRPRWASEGGGTEVPSDYIKGVSESDRTALNTREYMFFGYFQRIRSRLDVAWSATLRARLEKLYRRGRRLASERELVTRTWVTLDQTGQVVRVRLVQESGVLDLDEAAVSAFNDAGPFPNPPKGLMDQNGRVELHWDFVLRN